MGNKQGRYAPGETAVDKPDVKGVDVTSPTPEADDTEATPNVAVLEVDQFDSDGKLVESAAAATSGDQTNADDASETKHPEVDDAKAENGDAKESTENVEVSAKKDDIKAPAEIDVAKDSVEKEKAADHPEEKEETKEEIIVDSFTVDFDCGDFPFQNVVLIGDRVRSVAYCGAVQLLEETKIWERVKRISGCSAGALAAALLSVGYTGKDFEHFLTGDSPLSFQDRGWVDRIKPQQWNYAHHMYTWLGERIKEKADNADATFQQVYIKFGKELCIVATNLSQMTTEYFHPKTTPNIPIRLAVRMSMALPGRKRRKGKAIFQPVSLKRLNNERAIFIDGSLLDQQPISCFDGWWLSMAEDDAFLNRLQLRDEGSCAFNEEDRFSAYNTNTIGITVYDRNELDSLRENFEHRALGFDENKIPDTNISRCAAISTERCKQTATEFSSLITAANKLLEAIRSEDINTADPVKKTQLESILQKEGLLTEDETKLLFRNKTSADDVMKLIGMNQPEKVRYVDVTDYLEQEAYVVLQRCQAARLRTKRKGAETFYRATVANIEKVPRRDVDRCIGINAQYISTEDSDLEIEDVKYLIQQGRRATKAFLVYYGRKYVLDFDPDPARPFHRDELTKFIEDDLSEIIDIHDYNEDGSVRVRDK